MAALGGATIPVRLQHVIVHQRPEATVVHHRSEQSNAAPQVQHQRPPIMRLNLRCVAHRQRTTNLPSTATSDAT